MYFAPRAFLAGGVLPAQAEIYGLAALVAFKFKGEGRVRVKRRMNQIRHVHHWCVADNPLYLRAVLPCRFGLRLLAPLVVEVNSEPPDGAAVNIEIGIRGGHRRRRARRLVDGQPQIVAVGIGYQMVARQALPYRLSQVAFQCVPRVVFLLHGRFGARGRRVREAERVNGILKDEYSLDATFADYGQAQRACAEAITLYNTRRPHMALGLKTPTEAHRAA